MSVTTHSAPLSVGDRAPEVSLHDERGQPLELSSLWQAKPCVVSFVRHLGCPFCREHVQDLREAYGRLVEAGGEVAVVTMATPAQAAAFRTQQQLPFACLSDPERRAYEAFGLPRGTWLQVTGPAVWGAGWKAFLRGGFGLPTGDIRQLQGSFIIDPHSIIRFAHIPSNSAEQVTVDELLECLRQL